MSISIISTEKENGASCDHLLVTLNVEGETRTFKTTLAEIDALSMTQEDAKELIMRWAKYRRLQGRAIINVNIA